MDIIKYYNNLLTILLCLKPSLKLPKYIWFIIRESAFQITDTDFEACCRAGRPIPWYNYCFRTTDLEKFRKNHAFWHAEVYYIITKLASNDKARQEMINIIRTVSPVLSLEFWAYFRHNRRALGILMNSDIIPISIAKEVKWPRKCRKNFQPIVRHGYYTYGYKHCIEYCEQYRGAIMGYMYNYDVGVYGLPDLEEALAILKLLGFE